MGDGFLIINRDQVNALIGRLADPANLESCIDEVQRMVNIKKTLSWRADLGS